MNTSNVGSAILKLRQSPRGGLVAASFLILLTTGGRAAADISPDRCQGNGLGGATLRNKAAVQNGGTVTFTSSVRNDVLGTCDITGATVKLCCPDPTTGLPETTDCPIGQPSPHEGCCVIFAGPQPGAPLPPQDFPIPSPLATIGMADCRIVFPPNRSQVTAATIITGTLHDSAQDTS